MPDDQDDIHRMLDEQSKPAYRLSDNRRPSPWDCAKQGHVPVPEGGCLNCGADTTVPISRPCGHHGYRCDYDTCPDVGEAMTTEPASGAVCHTPDRCSEQHSYGPGCLLATPASVPSALDFPECRACQMWQDAGASWPRPCAKHYGGEPDGNAPSSARSDMGE